MNEIKIPINKVVNHNPWLEGALGGARYCDVHQADYAFDPDGREVDARRASTKPGTSTESP